MVKIVKKALISVLITVLGISVAQAAYPDRPITLIVPWSAGGGSDTSMRMLAEQLSKDMPVPVVVVNKPGAGGARLRLDAARDDGRCRSSPARHLR